MKAKKKVRWQKSFPKSHTSGWPNPSLRDFLLLQINRRRYPRLPWLYFQPSRFGLLTSMAGRQPLTFFLLVHQPHPYGRSRWEHQMLLPDTAAERVSVLWGHPGPHGWPPPPPARSLDWLRPWWHHASWCCAHPLARAKETVNMLFQLVHNHTFSSV